MLTYHRLDEHSAPTYRGLTFPAFRHLLELAPAVRFPLEGDRRRIQPLALGASLGGAPVGLAVAATPLSEGDRPELLSLFVVPSARRRGIAGALLSRLEELVFETSFQTLQTVYMTGKPEIDVFEHLLETRRWSPPARRMLVTRFTLQEMMSTPWFDRYRRRSRLTFFPWKDLSEQELAALRRSQDAAPWIAPDLQPWNFDLNRLEGASSIGIRLDGDIVGWVLNDRLDAQTVRFTCSFIREDLARRGRILPAYSESIRRASTASFTRGMFTVPAHHEHMAHFLNTWCAPWVGFVAETRSAEKVLGSAKK